MPELLHNLLHVLDIGLLIIVASTPVFAGAAKKALTDLWCVCFGRG